MARRNNRPSTVAGSIRVTPAIDTSSDQENEEPQPKRCDKGKGRAVDMPRTSLPTPSTDGTATETSRGQKRKRNEAPHHHATQPEDISDNEDPNEARFNRYYDPAQNPEKRRQLLRKSRALAREVVERRDDLLKGETSGLAEVVNRANNVFKNVKQTNDATLDSRLFVDVSGLTKKKTQQLVLGDRQAGLDTDTLVSKVIYFLQHGAPMNAEESAASTQRATQRRQRRANDDDDDEDEDDHTGEPFDWEHLGRHACFPYNSRPACPSFLLGPLSVEKKVRKQTQRTARHAKDNNVREARPEALTRADMSQSDENTLTAQCYKIKKQLEQYIDEIQAEATELFPTQAAMESDACKAWLKERRFTMAGGPSLFGYVLNPRSFGQTVENIFYISFLIKEGYLGIELETDDGMPALIVTVPTDPEQARKDDAQQRITSKTGLKHQAVIGIDWDTWERLVDAFDIDEPMIPHRDESEGQQVGARGWYT